MTPICRTPDCEHGALDDSLGLCPNCRHKYVSRRALVADLCGALYEQRPELFACLARNDARQLAEHLVAHVSEGEHAFYARFWAGMDFIRESRELRARRQLARSFITQRRHVRGVPRGAAA